MSTAVDVLDALDLDFIVHRLIPDNRRSQYWWCRPNADFDRRLDSYRSFAAALDGKARPTAQLVAPSCRPMAQSCPATTSRACCPSSP